MEKEKKVYEVPEMQVHQMMEPELPLCKSGSGTGNEGDLSRRIWVEDEDEE